MKWVYIPIEVAQRTTKRGGKGSRKHLQCLLGPYHGSKSWVRCCAHVILRKILPAATGNIIHACKPRRVSLTCHSHGRILTFQCLLLLCTWPTAWKATWKSLPTCKTALPILLRITAGHGAPRGTSQRARLGCLGACGREAWALRIPGLRVPACHRARSMGSLPAMQVTAAGRTHSVAALPHLWYPKLPRKSGLLLTVTEAKLKIQAFLMHRITLTVEIQTWMKPLIPAVRIITYQKRHRLIWILFFFFSPT